MTLGQPVLPIAFSVRTFEPAVRWRDNTPDPGRGAATGLRPRRLEAGMKLLATFAFAALMVAHMAAYFAVRRFHADDDNRQFGEIDAIPSVPRQMSDA
jgi:hypothetical protein